MYCDLFGDADKKTTRRIKKLAQIEYEWFQASLLESQIKDQLYSIIVPLYINDDRQLNGRFDAIEWPRKLVEEDLHPVLRDLDALLIWAGEVSPDQVERIGAAYRRCARFIDKHYPGQPFDVLWPHTI